MDQQRIDPWEWQDGFGYSQAIETGNEERVLYCAGQTDRFEQPSCMLLEVERLAFPELLVEIKATSVK